MAARSGRGYRVLKNPKTDPQREQVYEAENQFRPRQRWTGFLTPKKIRALIAEIRKIYKLPPCGFAYTREPGAWWLGLMETTYIKGKATSATLWCNSAHGGLNLQDVLHEMAHLITAKYFGHGIEHNPPFVGITLWLYDHYRVAPQDAYRCVLRRFKVKHKTFEESSPAALRSMERRKAAH